MVLWPIIKCFDLVREVQEMFFEKGTLPQVLRDEGELTKGIGVGRTFWIKGTIWVLW